MNSRGLKGFLPGLVAGLTLAVLVGGTSASAYHTNFQASCTDQWFNQGPGYRSVSRDYAFTAALEGYQWGGGCWNENDQDSSPGDPQEDPNTRGEGPDCSGLVFKSWMERAELNDGGWRYHYIMQLVHGPYTADSYRTGYGPPHVTLAKSSTIYMDAFASTTHVGMIYSHTAPGQDRMIEAKSEADGTGTWARTYRTQSAYGGARRVGWAG